MQRTVPLAVLMILVGAALRVVPLLVGAPVPHPDEFNATFWPLLVALGEPAPEVFYYPYFHTYVLALLHILHGVLVAPAAVSLHAWLGIQYFWQPDSALQLARWVNALCGCVTLVLVTGLARRLYGQQAAWIAAGLASVSVVAVRQSPVAGLDVPMTMWYVAAVWAAVRLATTSGPRAYVWAGLLVGLAASTKYHGALAATSILAAHVLAGRSPRDRRLWLAAGAAVAAFLAGSPYVVLTPGAFVEGFTDLVTHARTGLLDLGPGWIHHILFSLRVNLGWPGLTALVVGLTLALRNNDAGPRVAAAGLLGYYLVVGASPLVFARYALPMALLQCVFVAGAVQWLLRRAPAQQWALPVSLAILVLPSAYASLRVVDILRTPDTRQLAVDWIETHVPTGASLCNFGNWSTDPPLTTEAGMWWQVRRYVQHAGPAGLDALLPALERSGPPRGMYRYALQAGWQQYEAGNLRLIDEFACDYVLTSDHPLSPVRLDTAFVAHLPSVARHEVSFTPSGWTANEPPDGGPEYDPIDAYYVPVANFGELRQPGPSIDIWRVRAARLVAAPAISAREVIARAILRGALAALESGQSEDFALLQRRSMDIFPAAIHTASYRRQLGWSQRRLGKFQQAASEWRQSLRIDPGNGRLWLELGLLAAGELGEVETAAACFRQVLMLDPEHPQAPLLRSYLEARSDRMERTDEVIGQDP